MNTSSDIGLESSESTDSASPAPLPPDGLEERGRRLWAAVLADFELSQHELEVLLEACRCADSLDALHRSAEYVVDENGKPHPAIIEARQQRLALLRILATLRVPWGDEDEIPQRRGAARGAYGRREVES